MVPTPRLGLRFSSLPAEVRLMVWEETVERRILHITTKTTRLQVGSHPNHVRFKSREPPPIALQICHESRALALNHYTLSFHSYTLSFESSESTRASEPEQSALYFNPDLDIVCIFDDHGSDIFYLLRGTGGTYDEKTIQSIKMLALGTRTDVPVGFSPLGFSRLNLSLFRRLETLIVVVESEAGSTAEESILQYMEEGIFLTREFLSSRDRLEWKSPVLKLMRSYAFETYL